MIRIKAVERGGRILCPSILVCRKGQAMYFHAVVWLDHHTARIFGFEQHGSDHSCREITSHAPPHLHHKAGSVDGCHAPADTAYFDAIAATLANFREILIAGPATARTEFATHILNRHPDLVGKIIGNVPMDHAGDGKILAAARTFFHQADRMTPQH